MARRAGWLAWAVILACGCGTGGGATDAAGTWIGTITTEGNVTTVVTESGSVWSGTATLVEEASIGVASGAEEYMFGTISSIYASDDRIYVADEQARAVRAYDHAGAFVRSYGGEGQGPGRIRLPGHRSRRCLRPGFPSRSS